MPRNDVINKVIEANPVRVGTITYASCGNPGVGGHTDKTGLADNTVQPDLDVVFNRYDEKFDSPE